MADKKSKVLSIRESQRSYLNRDFNSFRSSLLEYSRTFFSDKLSDFSQNGFAGMLIELNAYVGDTMSYYIDHQFQELDINEATEVKNIERLIRNEGIKIVGASPSLVDVSFYMEIPALLSGDNYVPDPDLLPIIRSGTILSSGQGVKFTLMEDIDMSKTRSSGVLIAQYVTMASDTNGNPTSFSVTANGMCTSSTTSTETFGISNKFKPFRTLTLANGNVSEIISIIDQEGNEFYEVDALS